MIDLGIVHPGETIYIPFHTFDSNDPSASVTITGLATTDIEVYKDGSVTQRASDAGYTLLDTDGIDFDGTTGIHGISIDLADNTTAGFYEAGSRYFVVIASITVDAATINFVPVMFQIGYRGALVNTTIATLASQTSFTLEDASADDDAYNGWKAVIHDLASAVQLCVGYVSDYTGSTKTVTLAADPGIFTMAAGDNVSLFPPDNVQAVAGTAQTAGDLAALITTVDTVVDGIQTDLDNGTDGLGAIKTDTAAILVDTAEIGTAGAGLTDLGGMSTTMKAEVNAEADTAISDAALATAAALTTVDTVVDGIQTDLDNATDGLGALKALIDTVDTVVDAIKVVTDALPDAGALTTLQADTDDIQTRLPAALVGGKMDADMTAISGDTTAADRLEAMMDGVLVCQVNDASATTTAFAADGFTEATDDHFNGRLITFLTGALAGQQTDITDYDAAGHVQGSQAFVVTALTEAPANDDFFCIH